MVKLLYEWFEPNVYKLKLKNIAKKERNVSLFKIQIK